MSFVKYILYSGTLCKLWLYSFATEKLTFIEFYDSSSYMVIVWFHYSSDSLDHWLFCFCRFIYTFLGLGISLCVITCFGHIAAETANGCCLYMVPIFWNCDSIVLFCFHGTWRFIALLIFVLQYMFFLFLFLTLEGAVTADLLLNSHWEQVHTRI